MTAISIGGVASWIRNVLNFAKSSIAPWPESSEPSRHGSVINTILNPNGQIAGSPASDTSKAATLLVVIADELSPRGSCHIEYARDKEEKQTRRS